MPLDPNINNAIPQNCNIQEDNAQVNQTEKSNSNTNIQDNNSRNETGQQKDQSNNSSNAKVINSKKGKGNPQQYQTNVRTKTVNLAVMKQ